MQCSPLTKIRLSVAGRAGVSGVKVQTRPDRGFIRDELRLHNFHAIAPHHRCVVPYWLAKKQKSYLKFIVDVYLDGSLAAAEMNSCSL